MCCLPTLRVQIQILLHFFKLSLPGPCTPLRSPPTLSSPNSKKRKRGRVADVPSVPPTMETEERLEMFMDKLSMWQLVASLELPNTDQTKGKPDMKDGQARDWMQIFCEDVVEPLYVSSFPVVTRCGVLPSICCLWTSASNFVVTRFKAKLPEQCSLLRSKVFPHSVFSGSDTSSPRTSPPPTKTRRAKSPSSRATSRQRSISRDVTDSRSRSRSLSVSLAEDEQRARKAVISKPLMNREVSMSRGFKGKLLKGPLARGSKDPASSAFLLHFDFGRNSRSDVFV